MAHTPQKVVLTGAAGFIGSHVAEALLRRGDTVIGIDNLDPYYPEALKRKNLASIEHAARSCAGTFRSVRADICDAPVMHALFQEEHPTGVIHLAAKAGVRPSVDDPVGYARANVLGTAVMLEAARLGGCGRFVMASSSSVYGNNKVTPFHEEHDVSAPISPYAATKKACELIGHTHWHLTRMPVACLRFFTVYGPRQRPDLAIRLFMERIARGEKIPVYGSLDASRDYTFIDEIVRGVVASYDRVHEHGYRVWNLGSKHPVSLGEMIATIERVVGKAAVVERLGKRAGDVERTFADVERAGRELNFVPSMSFEEGVARQWEWMKNGG